jgi:hypothetical protein
MKTKTTMIALAVGTGLFVTGAVAQHEEHHTDQAAPPADKADTSKSTSMMSGKIMSQMPRLMMGQKMMMSQNETGKLVDRLIKSLAAIEAENDPAAVKERLAEHDLLLKELQANVQSQSHMMEMMQQHMMGGEHGILSH